MRTLTGKWYLKKKLLGGFQVRVQIEMTMLDKNGKHGPMVVCYEEARPEDLELLNISTSK